jgi:hypothetical protein
MTLSERIKASLPLADEFQRDGYHLRRVGSQFVSLCPFHTERTPSCYVNPATGRFHCFGCGENGSVIDYAALKRGITSAEAIAELAARFHHNTPLCSDKNSGSESAKPNAPSGARHLPKLPLLRKGSPSEVEQLAKLRRLSVEALQLASSRGLLWFCRLTDGPEKVAAWLITDRTRRNAQARRLDGERWHYTWDADARQWIPVEPDRQRKVRGFAGNQASWPVGIEEAKRFASIAILEGVDLLAAFHFLIAEDREGAVAPVAMLGAGTRIPNDALPLLAGKRVRIFPHVDDAGLRAAARWEAQLRPVVAHVNAWDFTGLTMLDGSPIQDLNDLASLDPDCFESEPELRVMMTF